VENSLSVDNNFIHLKYLYLLSPPKVVKESKEKYSWLSCFASKQSVEFTIKGILTK